jgi:hypothetical protein
MHKRDFFLIKRTKQIARAISRSCQKLESYVED